MCPQLPSSLTNNLYQRPDAPAGSFLNDEFPGYAVTLDGKVFEQSSDNEWTRIRMSRKQGYQYFYKVTKMSQYYSTKIKTQLHIFMLEFFICKRPPGYILALHNDGDHFNCILSNLRWGTYHDNAANAKRNRQRNLLICKMARKRHSLQEIMDATGASIRIIKRAIRKW